MANFIHQDFLLQSSLAKKLYHEYAKNLPLIDYHCHLDPREIYQNKTFSNLTDISLRGDHYKWRLMRANGFAEKYITGAGSDFEKFSAWSETVSKAILNPLFHWAQLELATYFNEYRLLNKTNAPAIYEEANKILPTLSVHNLLKMSKVEVLCTTDDPIDDLKYHKLIRESSALNTKVLPTFRPDKVFHISRPYYFDYLKSLGEAAAVKITTFDDLLAALEKRLQFFAENGSKISDHGLDTLRFIKTNKEEAALIFSKAFKGESLSETEAIKYESFMLFYLGTLYAKYNFVQQYHIGALRNINEKAFARQGADTGYDAINDALVARPLSELLSSLEAVQKLPKTVIYTLNPRDFSPAVTIIQAFQGPEARGKIQFGSAWWFSDNIDGMKKQIRSLGANGLLANFVGMLTDSRSFLSYVRHDYFRRLLCNIIAEEVNQGLFPHDEQLLKELITDISYRNAKRYFNL